jgi:hypothetical protein
MDRVQICISLCLVTGGSKPAFCILNSSVVDPDAEFFVQVGSGIIGLDLDPYVTFLIRNSVSFF